MPLKIALLQLPLQEPDSFSQNANIPLAAGYLAATAAAVFGGRVEIVIAPRQLVNAGSDEAIVRWIIESGCSLAGFTLYLWNHDRSGFIAAEAKRRSPGLLTAAGGPETAASGPGSAGTGKSAGTKPGGATGGRSGFDIIIEGEGEEPFINLLGDLLGGRAASRVYSAGEPLPLERIPNPYITKHLSIRPGDPVLLETMRGCPNRCSYCYYGKAYGGIRNFPEDRIGKVFSAAREGGASELYLMDPSFNASPGLEDRIRLIGRENTSRLPLHTELVLETMTPDRAALLSGAGFRSVEAGLQSVRIEVLRNVHRRFDSVRFEQGAKHLREAGIEVRTGVILGLPGDDLDGFHQTLDFILSLGLEKNLEIYPLAVLPGTELREKAKEFGLDYMPRPPYWVLETPTLPRRDLFAALLEAEDRLDIDYFRPIPPRFASVAGFMSYADLSDEALLRTLFDLPELSAADLTLRIPGRMLRSAEGLKTLTRLGKRLLEKNPYTLYKIVIEDDSGPLPGAAEEIAEAFFNPRHIVNANRSLSVDPQGKFSTRLFHLTSRIDLAEKALASGQADPVFLYEQKVFREARGEALAFLENRPFILIEGEIGTAEKKELAALYEGHEGLLIFSSLPV